MDIKIKKIVAKEGLMLLGVILMSTILMSFTGSLGPGGVFNYQCTYKGETQKLDIVTYFGPPGKLKAALWKNFIKKSPQTFSDKEKDLAKGGYPYRLFWWTSRRFYRKKFTAEIYTN